MAQTQITGAAGNRFGGEMAALIARAIGANIRVRLFWNDTRYPTLTQPRAKDRLNGDCVAVHGPDGISNKHQNLRWIAENVS